MSDDATGAYVFRVRFRVDPSVAGVALDPATFETTLRRRADPPGEDGWLFFRDNLWRGELADPDHFRELSADALGVPVESVTFSELAATEGYFDALHDRIAADADAFQQETPEAVVKTYLGSSIRVVD